MLRRDLLTLLFECHDSEAEDGELYEFLVSLGYDGYFFPITAADHRGRLNKGRGSLCPMPILRTTKRCAKVFIIETVYSLPKDVSHRWRLTEQEHESTQGMDSGNGVRCLRALYNGSAFR
jgi:hypothetical protein